MLRKNRAYKKGAPHRDARTFVIVAEGIREDEYFSWLNEANQRILIKIVPREEGKSAPKHFIDRLQKFIDSGEYSQQDHDSLWFVLDVDRWERKAIDELFGICQDYSNMDIAISNPCFEVWIHHHFGEIKDKGEDCRTLKESIPAKFPGGYNSAKICLLMDAAAENAKKSDTHPTHYFPERMETKVYLLAEKLLELLGKNWK